MLLSCCQTGGIARGKACCAEDKFVLDDSVEIVYVCLLAVRLAVELTYPLLLSIKLGLANLVLPESLWPGLPESFEGPALSH